MKDDYQTSTVDGAAAFQKYHNCYDETKLSKHDFDDEIEYDGTDPERDCPVCEFQGNRDKCEDCVNGSNFILFT